MPKVHCKIEKGRLSLRPYSRAYVQQYHGWFQNDPELLYLTGSQPLSLEEEYDNHRSWLEDDKKYTFIVFNQQGKMIGDVNLFFSSWIEPHQAEINIMIAPKQYRGKGYAREVLSLVEAFARVYYGRTEINAKIKDDNVSSAKLFNSTGYKFINHSDHFKEDEYIKTLEDSLEFYLQVLDKAVSQVTGATLV